MRVYNFIYHFSFAVVIALACSGDPSDSDRRPGNRFMKDDMEIVSSRAISFAVDDPEVCANAQLNLELVRDLTYNQEAGHLYLLNRENEIYKLDRQGRLAGKIVRPGHGPGEMDLPLQLKYRNNKLYVLDYNNNKFIVFDNHERWLQDIALHFGPIFSFEVTAKNEIILPRIIPVEGTTESQFLFIGHDGGKFTKFRTRFH